MKIAVVVQGRFHAFDLAKALIARGNDVTVFSNYPRWAVARFGIPRERVRAFPVHGVLARIVDKTKSFTGLTFEASLHSMFSRWAACQLRREKWDVIHAWTGVSEEIDSDPHLSEPLKLVMRGSAHIRIQSDLLEQEAERTGCEVGSPQLLDDCPRTA